MDLFQVAVNVLSGIGGAAVVVAALSGWIGKVWADRISRRHEAQIGAELQQTKARIDAALLRGKFLLDIDLDLRNRRIPKYEELWKITRVCTRWPRANGVTYQDLEKYSEELATWYYQTGGLFLSKSTTADGYYALQETLA